MFKRISKVKTLSSKTVAFSSNLQIGDCSYIDGTTLALAVQRKVANFLGNEGRYEDYHVFTDPLTVPIVNEPVRCCFSNPNPFICVDNIDFIGISTSSVVQIGNVGHVRMQSRVKHIRQITTDGPSEETTPVSSGSHSST